MKPLAKLLIVTILSLNSLPLFADTAIFAGGCFWCMQPPYDKLKSKGVISTAVGYTGGVIENPTYEQVSSGATGHIEAIEITYDAKKITYKELLKVFWENIDPYDAQGQFCDKGEQYISAVFYQTESQKNDFQNSLDEITKKGIKKEKIVTKLIKLKKFYKAEAYHQEYYVKNPIKYKFYRSQCGRDKRLKEIWSQK